MKISLRFIYRIIFAVCIPFSVATASMGNHEINLNQITIPNGPYPNFNSHANPNLLNALTKYEDLVAQLNKLGTKSEYLTTAPLIINNLRAKNANGECVEIPGNIPNGGLIAVDAATRQALVDSVTNGAINEGTDRGNKDPGLIGYSNECRALMGAKFGHGPIKIMFWTQVHGNEWSSTEAGLEFLKDLVNGNSGDLEELADKVTLLMAVRVNPDGGEPDPDNCFVGDPLLGPLPPGFDCHFRRYNLDRSAGGGFLAFSEPGFVGQVGLGYDLNRYFFMDFDNNGNLTPNGPIRPVETQAVIGGFIAFKGNTPSDEMFVADFHGQDVHVTCPLVLVGVTAVGPDFRCAPDTDNSLVNSSVLSVATNNSNPTQQAVARSWSVVVHDAIERKGYVKMVSRLNQGPFVPPGIGLFDVSEEGVATLVIEVANLATDSAGVVEVTPLGAFVSNVSVGIYPNLGVAINIHKTGIQTAFDFVVQGATIVDDVNNVYCSILNDTGFVTGPTAFIASEFGITDTQLFNFCTTPDWDGCPIITPPPAGFCL